MKLTKLRKYCSVLTVSSGLLILYHLGLLIFDYAILARGEGWGVVYVFGALFWLSIVMIVGLLIRRFVKPTKVKLIVECSIFIFLLLFVIENL